MEKVKKIIGILGSPRRGGNTEILLDAVLEAAQNKGADVKKFILNELEFVPCQECENIRRDGICIVEDDWQKIFAEVENADTVVLASPIFFGSVSAQMKMFIDRFQCLWLAKYVFKTCKPQKKKIGAFICVEASERKDFFENAKSIVKNLFATIGAEYKFELFCPGIDAKAAINKKPGCLKKAAEIGDMLTK
ncbi:MAG: flavodoxin family protein [Candidatus Ratteibacteria bacterium]|nr:flavodoxin family protein [Candidatus Ratteibacteria bacterium]